MKKTAKKKPLLKRRKTPPDFRREAKAYKERHKREMEEQLLPYMRDMFAGNALTGLAQDLYGPASSVRRANLATECYEIADAMMAARRPSHPNPKRSKPKA